jgi:hypothetical protein
VLWRGIEIGPRLARGEREVWVGLDARSGATLHLRWFRNAPASLELPETPWPAEAAASLARPLRLERSGSGVLVGSELALGPTLELLLGTPQPVAVVAGLLSQLLAGLEVMHGAGRAHGRIHPGNLVLDVNSSCLRLVDLWASALEGVPRGADPRKLYIRPGAAQREPGPGDDVYAAGRVAEALLRGGAPLGAWAPLVPSPGEPRDRFARLSSWIERCQTLDAAKAFGSSADALAALKSLGEEGEQSVAQVRSGGWVAARRRAERAMARWRLSRPVPRQGPEEFEELLSSLRATWLWRRIGMAAGGAVVLSALVASKPHLPSALGGEWSDDACLEEVRPKLLSAGESPAPGAVALELQGPAGSSLAIDGCPLVLPAEATLRAAVAPGRHELRAKAPAGVVAESILAGPGEPKLAIDRLPLATQDGTAGAKVVEGELKQVLAEVVSGAAPSGVDSLKLAFLNPAVAAVLEIDARGVADVPAVRASLPDDLALALDALRAAAHRFEITERPCTERLEQLTTAALQVRQPEAPPATHHAATLLAALRLGDEAGRNEGALRHQLGVVESPMLNATVDQVVGDAELKRCAEGLKAPSKTLAELTEHCLAQLASPLTVMGSEVEPEEKPTAEPSSGSAR